MTNDFICPSCSGHLVVENFLVLSVKNSSDKKGLIFLSPQIGDYSSFKNRSFELPENEAVEVFCPICKFDLRMSSIHENLVRIVLVNKEDKNDEIYFSCVVGEQCTFKVRDGEVLEYHGNSYLKYLNAFTVGRRI